MAVQKGHVDCLRLLAEHKANLDLPEKTGYTPTLMAVQKGHRDCVQVLVDHKADVNQAFQGWTPLMFAQDDGHTEIVEILLAAGAK